MTLQIKPILFSLFVFSFLLSKAGQIEVCPTCEIKSVTEGIAKANSYDTLFVIGGHYKEGNIIVDKSISIIGKNWPVIDGENGTEIDLHSVVNFTESRVSLVELKHDQLEELLRDRASMFDCVILSSQENAACQQFILKRLQCPVILVSEHLGT